MDNRVALDTGVLRRLVTALTTDTPQREPDTESVALVRIFFYDAVPLVVPTVSTELDRPQDSVGSRWRDYHFEELPDIDEEFLGCAKGRSETYLDYHPDPRDCRVVAEAECAKVSAFLTEKQELLEGLGTRVQSIAIQKPSEYWATLGTAPGTPPTNEPVEGNPLAGVQWWRW
jgi:hypothetical protein